MPRGAKSFFSSFYNEPGPNNLLQTYIQALIHYSFTMSQDSRSHYGSPLPTTAPTFTADATLACKMRDGALPGSHSVSRLSCGDPDVMGCFTTRQYANRDKDYHERIATLDPQEYQCFGEPGRGKKYTLRVWTTLKRISGLPSSGSQSISAEIDPGAGEGHMFREKLTRAVFMTTLDSTCKCDEDVPTEGWVRLHGQISVSCTFIRMPTTQKSMGVYVDVNLGLGRRGIRR